jgi:hypothetical protein
MVLTNSLNPRTKVAHIKERLKRLITFDTIRYYKFLEIIQYTILYCIFGFIFAIIANKISSLVFEPFNPQTTDCSVETLLKLLTEVTLQLCFISISIFYIIKIVKIIPLAFTPTHEFIPYQSKEYAGGIAISFMFLKMQPYLSAKLTHMMKCIMEKTGTTT